MPKTVTRFGFSSLAMGMVLLLAACGPEGPTPTRPAAGGAASTASGAKLPWKASATGWRLVRRLSIRAGASFSSLASVEQGTVVLWKNGDAAPHMIVGMTEAEMRSPILREGESFAYLFEDIGAFFYMLDDDPRLAGMIEVVAGNAVNGAVPPLQASLLKLIP